MFRCIRDGAGCCQVFNTWGCRECHFASRRELFVSEGGGSQHPAQKQRPGGCGRSAARLSVSPAELEAEGSAALRARLPWQPRVNAPRARHGGRAGRGRCGGGRRRAAGAGEDEDAIALL